jgi:general secretion pathway protein N
MIRGKRIAIALGGTAAVLGGVLLAQELGLGSQYSLTEDLAPPRPVSGLGDITAEAPKLNGWPEYAEVLSRPLFNESRAPEEVEAPVIESAGTELNATLTGVIVSGQLQLAIVRDNETNESQRVRMGQPMEGKQAGWTLVELKPRMAVFQGSGAERKELELQVDTKGATAVAPVSPTPSAAPVAPSTPMVPVVPGPATTAGDPVAAQPGQPASAEEIRKRIEERRKQLREEAQRMLEQQNQGNKQ